MMGFVEDCTQKEIDSEKDRVQIYPVACGEEKAVKRQKDSLLTEVLHGWVFVVVRQMCVQLCTLTNVEGATYVE